MADAAVVDVRNPRTGEVDHRIAVASREEVASKAAQLRENQRAWHAEAEVARTATSIRPITRTVGWSRGLRRASG